MKEMIGKKMGFEAISKNSERWSCRLQVNCDEI